MPYANQNNTGLYIQQTPNFDVSEFYTNEIGSERFKQLLVLLYEQINTASIILNQKVSGYNLTTEFVNSKVYYPSIGNNPLNFRQVFQISVDFGSLPAAGTKSVAHNIGFLVPTTYTFTNFEAVATNSTLGLIRPMPYVDITGGGTENIQINADSTYVNITTGGMDYSGWTGKINFEYIKI